MRKSFICYMFRSMYEDAERRQAELEAQKRERRRGIQDKRRPPDNAGRALYPQVEHRRAAPANKRIEG